MTKGKAIGSLVALAAAWTVATILALSGVGCAWTQTQVHSLQQCSPDDAKVILDASAEIVAATADAKDSGQLVTSMLRVINSMAQLNTAWARCKSTSHESARALEGARGSGVDVATLGELLGGG